MTHRYEIQEILEQDANGVVFRAVERDGGRDVVLRRFFPFGANGGGLDKEEQEAYAAAVGNLRKLEHPALRKVLDGSCDPVDGVPFLITEWVEGEQLSRRLEQKPLSTASARALLGHAIEASRLLAKVLGKDAVWVETAPDAIILSEGEGGRGVNFWICPFRWLGENGTGEGLFPLATLAEEALHWRGRVVADSAGEGLGAWVRAIKADPQRWTLKEARDALEAVPQTVDAGPASTLGLSVEPTIAMPGLPARPLKVKQKKPVLPWVLVGVLVLAVAGLSGALKMRNSSNEAAVSGALVESSQPKAGRPAQESAGQAAAANAPSPVAENEPVEQQPPPSLPAAQPASSGVAPPPAEESAKERIERLAREMAEQAAKTPAAAIRNQPAEITGVVEYAQESGSGKTRYLRISDGTTGRWVGIRVAAAGDVPGMEYLNSLKGRKIRIRGEWQSERSHRGEVLFFKSREAIEPLD